MPITKLTIENFKSFDRVEVELRDFNVVVGPNAAGKSNLIEAVAFLKDIAERGLEDAVAIHGGIKVLRNFDADIGQLLRVGVEYDEVENADEPVFADGINDRVLRRNKEIMGVKKGCVAYDFSIRPHKRGAGFNVVHDELSQRITLVELRPSPVVNATGARRWVSSSSRGRGADLRETKTLGEGTLTLSRIDTRLQARINLSSALPLHQKINPSDISPVLSHRYWGFPKRSLMLEFPLLRIVNADFWRALENTRIYDFDPKKPKQAVPIAGVKELDGDGGNLAIVLQEILRRAKDRRRFVNLVSDLLPFVDSVGVDTLAYNSLLAKLTERRSSGKRDMSVAWASDGTISVLAMVAALFFEEGELAVFEEPERNMHPHLIGRLVQMMKEASENKQIILTTHNPEMLRHSDLEDILLVQRDDDGNSAITRPADSATLKIFLENELGIEDPVRSEPAGDMTRGYRQSLASGRRERRRAVRRRPSSRPNSSARMMTFRYGGIARLPARKRANFLQSIQPARGADYILLLRHRRVPLRHVQERVREKQFCPRCPTPESRWS